MIFSSPLFLFLFLPVVLLGYYFMNTRLRNLWLLAASLFFYCWGEPKYIVLMLSSVCLNFFAGRIIDAAENACLKKTVLAATIAVNIGLLGYFKYFDFFAENINSFIGTNVGLRNIVLPIGISFYTFQAMSYVIDVYRGKAPVQKSILRLGLYISFFPQLIAGPIVRYSDVAEQIETRRESVEQFSDGVRYFILGFGKKILIADTVAAVADAAFAAPGRSVLFSWIGVLAYTLQIYYDFCGYSDMAIGLGKMFGFEFQMNFNFPYISQSVTEFWKRWHISLSGWFRDYVYIPLGGNRCSMARNCLNIFIIFFLSGLWHGASWNFVLWGVYYSVFLIFERLGFQSFLQKIPTAIRWLYAILIIMFGWILFRADTVQGAASYFIGLFRGAEGTKWTDALLCMTTERAVVMALGVIFASKAGQYARKILLGKACIWKSFLLIGIFSLAVVYMVGMDFSPFLYFRF